ncbi:hypothetical protein HO173_004718 [Letharia columbiana]|uniref:Nudix hydrolase domain-containing protein n=1 Tax=Letharia columbiana TaxID=112416 RepID=A0A8H6FYH1_9LECA|nr:uncharacterized protein HO173_004718 [Letharia columbiana]KAF6237250.1 hypothetical protein HO173_004718 [Letharia columbiana]
MSQKAGLYQEHTNIPKADLPIVGNWDSANTTIGAGVAIFHLASSRVVLCYHSTNNYYFLPKGRRDASEDTGSGAEREGFEESGYRNRLLPLPIPTRQPKAHNPSPSSAATTPFVTEPVWTQLVPVTRTAQYILFWYIAETVPPDLEVSLSAQEKEQGMAYQYPPKFNPEMTLRERMEVEREGYEPVRHENTGVDAEEALYESYLMPVEEAIEKLGRGISADVVRKGWEAIQLKHKMEDGR